MKKFLSIVLAVCIAFSCALFVGCVSSEKDITAYDISIEYSNGKVEGVMEVDFFNSYDNVLDKLKFNLHANAFRKEAKFSPVAPQYVAQSYPNGISYGEMSIVEVLSYGEALDFIVEGKDKNVLTVNLNKHIYPEERVVITIKYTITLADVIARTGINESTINLANFYPSLCAYDIEKGFYECVYYPNGDPYYSECANYRVSITLDQKYTVASSGKLIKETTENGKVKREYSIEKARSFAFVLSEGFESVTDTSTGVEVIYYFYDDDAPNKALTAAVKSINLFTEKFGKYPYPTYSVVQTKFVQGGMEFPALVMISDALEKEAYVEVVVHETAHQWWQTVVGNNEIEYGFLDEGLAEYSVVVFYENYPEYNFKREALIEASEKTYKLFCSVYDKLFGEVDTRMIRSLGEFGGDYEYVNIAYVKPCIMYDYLRRTIGDKGFFEGLAKYYKEFSFKNATPDDLVGVFERCGKDTNGFFKSFFDGKVVI